jgi:hypothetical protein
MQQKNGINSLENRFSQPTQLARLTVCSIENSDAKNEYFCCSVIRRQFRDPRFEMICPLRRQSFSFSASFLALSIPGYTCSCASETVGPA